MSQLTHLSLFSGIGGLDLAAEAAGFQTVGQCEWADYPTKVLKKNWPDVPRWRDIRTLTGDSFYERTGLRTVYVISGGFPCQPFSVAGKRRGAEDDRYLWPEMLRVIQELKPRWVVGENVAGIVNMALDTVLSDLENLGYSCQSFIIPACAVDAPHRRDRCAIVAYSNSGGHLYREFEIDAAERGKQTQPKSIRCCETVPDAYSQGLQGSQKARDIRCGRQNRKEQFARLCGGWWATQSRLGRNFDGISAWMDEIRQCWRDGSWEYGLQRIAKGVPNRVERLKCLGNAVVPAQFYPIFKSIAEITLDNFSKP